MTLLLLGSWAIAAQASEADDRAPSFPYEIVRHDLPSGLRVYAIPMPTPGVVAWESRVAVGSGAETEPGRTGFAHFFEHLSFHGTEALPREARGPELLRLGVDDGGWTWFDETTYPALLPAGSLPRWVEIEADRFQHLALTPDGVRREAGAVYGEYRKTAADPEFALEERLMAKMFGAHPYGHTTLGLEADIAAMPDAYEPARAFFDAWYRPEHVAIVVAGDVTPDDLFARVDAAYGSWKNAPVPAAPPPAPVPGAPTRVEVSWPNPIEPVLLVAWPTVAVSDPKAPALEWAASLLSAPGGPLDTRLVRAGLARVARAWAPDTVQTGWFQVRVVASDAADLPEIERVVLEEVARLGAEGPAPDRLDALRTRARYALLSGLDDPTTVAGFVGGAIRRDPDPAAIDARLKAEAAVTPGDVAAVATELLRADRAFVGTVVGGAP